MGVDRLERGHTADICYGFDVVGCLAKRLVAFEVVDGENNLLAVLDGH